MSPEILNISPEMVGFIVALVLALNAFLFGAYKALEILKDKTESKLDNSAYEIIGKILNILKKIVEVVGPVTVVKEEKK